MEIGKPKHVYRVEPLVNPVPQKVPVRPPAPPERAEPLKPEPVKAK